MEGRGGKVKKGARGGDLGKIAGQKGDRRWKDKRSPFHK